MAITVKHSKVSSIPDGDDTSVVRPSDWNADHTLTGTIPVANGGTGASTLTGYVKGNGTAAMTASATVPSTDITGLGTMSTQNSNNISVTGGSMSGVTISDYVATATKGVANGVASLDGSGTVPISQLPAAVLGALSYQGTWNASTNTPTLTSSVGTKGYYYVVSVAGSTNLNGITDWVVGDWAVYNGTAWQKVDNTDAVTSVNGYTGTVVLTTTDVAEGTNQYFTTARARTSVSAGTGISYDSGTGVITNSSPSLGGDVVGPASSTDNAIARFDTTTGKLLQNSVVTVGDTGAVTGVTTFSASTSVTTPIVQASNSGGLSLKNSAGTTQISMGAGGGDNASINVSTNINGTNAQIDISPTGTGHVHINPTGVNSIQINPTYVGTMDNMTIGATTPKAITGTTITATTFSGSGASLTSIPNSALVNSAITINGTSTSLGGSISVGTVTSVTGTSPVVSSGGATPAISMPAATTSVDGYLTSTDWNTFNGKGSGSVTSVAATVPSFLSVTGSPITTSGTLALTYSGTALPILNGGTGQTTANAAFNALAPSQTSNSGKYLTSNGTDTSWASLGNAYSRTSFTATASQTTFTVSYTVGLVQVYVNGVLLNGADYTATNGTSVVLAVACNAGEIVEVLAFTSFSVASTVSSFSAGTTGLTPSTGTTGNVTLGGTLAVANGGTGVTTKTGTGNVVLSTSPSLTTPAIAGATSGSITLAVPAVAGTNTITFPASTGTVFLGYPVNYLMVAGGGGGGGSIAAGGGAAGGGAGGLISNTLVASSGTVYTITVGAGGAGGIGSASPTAATNSSITGLTEAVAGGAGGYNNTTSTSTAGASGGSGGGGAYRSSTGGSGTSGQGNAGGGGLNTAANYPGGGGGGSSTVGSAASSGTVAGAGGAGTSNSITGSSVIYAAGGGGGTYVGGTAGAGGSSGVGGAGGVANATGGAGTVNTGSGGGGSGCTASLAGTGGAGGSGVVILSIPTTYYSGTTTGSPTVTTSGSNTILKYTSSGTYTA